LLDSVIDLSLDENDSDGERLLQRVGERRHHVCGVGAKGPSKHETAWSHEKTGGSATTQARRIARHERTQSEPLGSVLHHIYQSGSDHGGRSVVWSKDACLLVFRLCFTLFDVVAPADPTIRIL
jgi:hypothetical protein